MKKYVSSNSKIFTVNGSGKVTAKSAGTATLTAYLASGKKLSTKITVIAGWITYELNGGKNSKGNPSMYTGKRYIVLKNPTKNGYVFLGWYQDHYFEKPIYKIKKGTTGNIKLYAKWRNIHEFYDSIPN